MPGGFFATNNPPAVTRQPGDADHDPFLLQNIAVSACASEHPDKIIHILENIGQNKECKDEQNDTAGDDDAKGKPVGSSLLKLDISHILVLLGDIVMGGVDVHLIGRLDKGR